MARHRKARAASAKRARLAAPREIPATALLGRLARSGLASDDASAQAMLSLLQAAYDCGRISRQAFLAAEGEIVKAMSNPKAGAEFSWPAPNHAAAGTGKLLSLLSQREALEKTLDSLADAAAAGRITAEAYDKLYICNSEKLSAVLSAIEAEATSERPVESGGGFDISGGQAIGMGMGLDKKNIPILAGNENPAASASETPSGGRAGLPSRAAAILESLHSNGGMAPERYEHTLSGYRRAVKDLEQTDRQNAEELGTIRREVESLASSLEDARSELSLMAGQLQAQNETLAAAFSAKPPEQAQAPQGQAQAVTDRVEGALAAKMTQMESKLQERFEEMRRIVAKVEEIYEAVKVSREIAERSETLHKQITRTEKLADLMGRAFVESASKFKQMEEISKRQNELSEAVEELAKSVTGLSAQVKAISPPAQGQGRQAREA